MGGMNRIHDGPNPALSVVLTMELPDIRQLMSFVALAETRSFTQAAEKVFRTQSAISHSIKGLESLLNEQLVERMGKSIVLTPQGTVYLQHAKRALQELELAATKLNTLKHWGVSTIRVGAADTVCQYVLPGTLRKFRETSGNCDIKIETGNTATLLEMLKEGLIDFVIGIETTNTNGFQKIRLASDTLSIVVSPDHSWAHLKTLESRHMESESFIVYGQRSSTFQLVEKYFDREGIRLRPPLTLGNMEGIKEMTRLGLGPGIVAPWTVRQELADGVLVKKTFGSNPLKRRWTVFTNRGKTFSLAEETFIGTCKETLRTVLKGK